MVKDSYSVRLRKAGLAEINGEIVAQGFLDIEALNQLKVDDYQREVLRSVGMKDTRRTQLEIAVAEGATLPSVVIGMRGQSWRASGDDMLLADDLYIVDGLQRISAMKSHAEKTEDQGKSLLIGAEVRFATDKYLEKELFQVLNVRRTPMSPNVILRNSRDKSKAVLTIYGMSVSDSTSPLFDRVQWSQRRSHGQLMTALTVVHTILAVHQHVTYEPQKNLLRGIPAKGLTGGGSGVLGRLIPLESKALAVGLKTFRENILEFFEMVDECYGLRHVEFNEICTHLRTNFLHVLAQLISSHQDFWKGDRLEISTMHKKKLASFPIDAPEVVKLAGGSNTTKSLLYAILKRHMDKGVKTKHLRPRMQEVPAMAAE